MGLALSAINALAAACITGDTLAMKKCITGDTCGSQHVKQTADHILIVCSKHQAPHEAQDLTVLDDKT